MGKTKLQPGPSSGEDSSCPARLVVTEAEVKYKLFMCHTQQGEHAQALNVLQSVPVKQKLAKHHMALGKLYERGGPGMKRAAISCYKEVVKSCPMAMEAAQKLMQLGVKAKEIQELTLEVSGGKEIDRSINESDLI